MTGRLLGRLLAVGLPRLDAGAESFEGCQCCRGVFTLPTQFVAERLVAWLLPERWQQAQADVAGPDLAGERVPLLVDAHWFPLNCRLPLVLRYSIGAPRANTSPRAAEGAPFTPYAGRASCLPLERLR